MLRAAVESPTVDHNGEHSRGCRAADNTLGATRRAEWCIKEPDAIHVDGILFSVFEKKSKTIFFVFLILLKHYQLIGWVVFSGVISVGYK